MYRMSRLDFALAILVIIMAITGFYWGLGK